MSDDRFKDPHPDRFHVDRNQPVTAHEMRVWLERFAQQFGIKAKTDDQPPVRKSEDEP